MRNPNHVRSVIGSFIMLAVLVCLPQFSRGQVTNHLTMIASDQSGQTWTTLGTSGTGNPFGFVTNAPATWFNTTPLEVPIAGNTYEEVTNGIAEGYNVNNTRLRNPTGAGSSQVFPGDQLTLDTNCEMRFKVPSGYSEPYPIVFPGVNGNPGLVLQGAFLDDGDNGTWNIQGTINVAGDSSCVTVLAPGGNIGNATAGLTEQNRDFIIGGQVSGAGTLAVVLTPTNNIIMVTNGLNTFTGNWIIQEGWLAGTTPQCLGSANILVDPLDTNAIAVEYPGLQLETSTTTNIWADPTYADSGNTNDAYAVLDFDYAPVCTGTLILTNGGMMNLHTNCLFGSLIIEGHVLPIGVYTYSQLTNSGYTNFMPGGVGGSITIAAPVAPPAPTNVAATPLGLTSNQVSWIPTPTATGYIVNRSATSNGTYTAIGTTNSLDYIDSGLTTGVTYWYKVQATNAFGTGLYSTPAVSATPSAPVTGLVISSITATTVNLSWNSYADALGYQVERTAVYDGTPVAIGTAASTHYADTNIANGTEYYYVVVAELSAGPPITYGAPSTVTNALTYPSVPSIIADLYGANNIYITTATTDPVTPGYFIQGSTDGVHYSPLALLGSGTNYFLDQSLSEGTEYYFEASASNSTANSAFVVASNSIPNGTISFAFGLPTSPVPSGYTEDLGLAYENQGEYTYGWATNNENSPGVFTPGLNPYNMTDPGQGEYNPGNPPGDLRRQSLIHQIKDQDAQFAATNNFANLSAYPYWAVTNITDGVYFVRVVSGDATASDSTYQQSINGVTTLPVAATTGSPFAQWWVVCEVTNTLLTVEVANTNNGKLDYIDIYPAVAPSSSFTYGPVSGPAPLTVNFTNTSTGDFTGEFWSFDNLGDTLSSTNQVVSFTYTTAGTYNVSVTASNIFQSASPATILNAVTVTAAVPPGRMWITNSGAGNLEIAWTNPAALLLSTTNLVTGPWVTNVSATSPFAVVHGSGQMFYRLMVP